MTMIDTLKQIDLIRFISDHYGAQFDSRGFACCPIHGENTPSFSVMSKHDGTQMCSCFGSCQKQGMDIIDFVQEKEGLDTGDAIRRVCELEGIRYEATDSNDKVDRNARKEELEEIKRFMAAFPLQDRGRHYLLSRGYPVDFVNSYGFGFVEGGSVYAGHNEVTKRLGLTYASGHVCMSQGGLDRLLIPFYEGKNIVYIAGRRVDNVKDGKYHNMAGQRPALLKGNTRGDTLYLFEGITDTLWAMSQGLPCAGFLGGAGGDIELPGNIKKVIICTDGDPAGDMYREKHGKALYESRSVSFAFVERGHDYQDCGKHVSELETVEILEYYRQEWRRNGLKYRETVFALMVMLEKKDGQIAISGAINALKKTLGNGVTVKDIRADFQHFQQKDCAVNQYNFAGRTWNVPQNHAISRSGVISIDPVATVCHDQVLVTNTGVDHHTGTHHVEVSWNTRDGETVSHVVPRLTIADASKLIALANHGLDVATGNQVALCLYLNEFLNANEYPDKMTIVSRIGWLGDAYVLPDRIITPDGVTAGARYIGETIRPEMFSRSGTLVDWIAGVRELKKYPVPVFCIYVAFAGLILSKLGATNSLIVNLSSPTSTGKTLTTGIALSGIGKGMKGENSLIMQFIDTAAFVERILGEAPHTPRGIDEQSATKTGDGAGRIRVYKLSEGLQKGKASGGGNNVIAARRFLTSLITNGEMPLLQDGDTGGAHIRTISIPFPPFPPDMEEFIHHVKDIFTNNHGMALDPFLQTFMKKERKLIKLPVRKDFQCYGNATARYIDQFNYIYTAGLLLEEAFNFGFDSEDIINTIISQTVNEVHDSVDHANTFMHKLQDWVRLNSLNIHVTNCNGGINGIKTEILPKGGEIKAYLFERILPDREERDLAITSEQFHNLCEKFFGHRTIAKNIAQALDNKCYLECDRPRLTHNVRISGSPMRVYYIKNIFTDTW